MRLRRDFRYDVESDDTTKVVRFHDFQDQEHTCQVTDYSRTGVAFIMEDGSLIFKIGDIIPDLRFYSLDNEVHRGSATIVHIQDEEQWGKVISRVGCSFIDGLMDVYSIIKADKITKLQNEFLDFVQSMAIEESLDPEFINLTSHLHYILSGFNERLKQEEENIQKEDEELKPVLAETLRDLAFESLYEELNRYYDHFTKVVGRFTDSKQHFIHREYFQKKLGEFFMKSKLFQRAYTKPLGYAGDFEMMNIIYRNQFEGDDLFSQIMNKIDCEGSGAKAVRNRRTFFYEKIRALVMNSHNQEVIKIMSVACGPTLEFYDFVFSLRDKKIPIKIKFIAIDQDRNALDDARSRIDPLLAERDDIELHYVEENIKRLIVGKDEVNDLYIGSDLIYTAGLFDYLSERASNRLIHKLYTFLNPGGTLIVGNFGPYNPQRFIMDYGCEWFLLYRSEEDIKALASGLPENVSMDVEREPEGINLFLNIKKP
ncbi:MAG: PilZ domain-containing protein [Deltaproteobacteria bacterium]|nr:PilZ domain-containing protein [Deltaproteobacteria bacterium]